MAESLTHNLKQIGRYSILRELRRERYTAAYLALDPVLNREVVVKAVQLRPAPGQALTGHDRIDQAFTRQAQAAGRLIHPHIVAVFDAGRVQNVGYLALEMVRGTLLAEALTRGFDPAALKAADIVARVADAVEFAHAHGIPHGHLGVSRIWLEQSTHAPKVMGFGGWIDTGVTGDFELSATAAMLPYFENTLSAEARRKDLRALGAVLFLLLTGARPDFKALTERRSADSPVLFRRPTVPPALAQIAERALGCRGAEPFDSAGAMRDALTRFLGGERDTRALPNVVTLGDGPDERTCTASPTAGPKPRPAAHATRSEPVRRRTVGAIVCAVVALVALALLGVRDEPEDPLPSVPGTAVRSAPARVVEPATLPTGMVARTAAQTTTFGPTPAGRPAAAAPPVF